MLKYLISHFQICYSSATWHFAQYFFCLRVVIEHFFILARAWHNGDIFYYSTFRLLLWIWRIQIHYYSLIFTHSPYAYWGGMAGAAPPFSHHILMARVCVHRKTWTSHNFSNLLFPYKTITKCFYNKEESMNCFFKRGPPSTNSCFSVHSNSLAISADGGYFYS